MQEAIILAGGLGTRLQKVLKNTPKAMAPVNGRPFLEYLIGFLKSFAISRIIVSVGYRSEQIISFFGSEYKGLEIDYAIEKEPRGTGGGIRLAMLRCNSKNVFAINGDTLFTADLSDLAEKHFISNKPVSIALRKVDDVSRYGSVSINEKNIVTAFGEKSTYSIPGLINAGIYLLNRDYFLAQTGPGNFSIEKDCFEKWVSKGQVSGYPYDAYFLDIGVPQDYLRAQHEFGRFTY